MPINASLTWQVSPDTDTSEVERKIDPETTFTVIATGLTTPSFLDQNLAQHTLHTYRVRAFNEIGPSGYSNEASATTPGIPATPTNLILQVTFVP